jgi:hypothetical protein
MTSQIDRFPVKELPNRYSINRSVLYTRLEKLGIKTTKEKNQSFIDGDSLNLLDALDEHLKNGGTTSEFLDQTTNPTDKPDKSAITFNRKDSDDKTDKLDRQDRQTEQLAFPGILEQLANLTLDAVESRRTGLNDLRDLQEIADNNWLLPTSRLVSIIGRSRSYFTGKKEVNYCGFRIEKVGKQGNETLWQVSHYTQSRQ